MHKETKVMVEEQSVSRKNERVLCLSMCDTKEIESNGIHKQI